MVSSRQIKMALFALLFFTAGCAPTISNRGNMLDADALAEIKVGTSTREDVATKLGTPTQVSTFDENRWYYFGQTTKQYAFFDPEVVNQETVEVRFNDEGVVTSLEKLNPDASRDISPVDRRTPTYGHETTVFEQLVGNLSRRSGDASKK